MNSSHEPGTKARSRDCVVGLIAVTIALVTFPWDTQDHAHWMKVAWIPFKTGIVRPLDLLANALLYLPLGYVLQARSPGDKRLVAAVLGATLSSVMELTQVWSHVRFPSSTDVTMNIAGASIGAAWAFHRMAGRASTATVSESRRA